MESGNTVIQEEQHGYQRTAVSHRPFNDNQTDSRTALYQKWLGNDNDEYAKNDTSVGGGEGRGATSLSWTYINNVFSLQFLKRFL